MADSNYQFHHCIAYSLSIMVTDEASNPWVQHVAPMCFAGTSTSADALKSAFLAFGATHLYSIQLRNRNEDDATDYHAVAKRNRALSVQRLREVVRHGGVEMESDTFLASALALLLNDVSGSDSATRRLLTVCFRCSQRARPGVKSGGTRSWPYDDEAGRTTCSMAASGRRHCYCSVSLATPGSGTLSVSSTHKPSRRLSPLTHAVAINTMTSPALLTGDLTWWRLFNESGPSGQSSSDPSPPHLGWDWFEKFNSFHPRLFAISAVVVECAVDRAVLEHVLGPFDLHAAGEHGSDAVRSLAKRAAAVAAQLDLWRYELPTALSAARIQLGSLAFWHAMRILLLTQVYSRTRTDRDVQKSAGAVIELCMEAGDKPEFLQLVSGHEWQRRCGGLC